MSLGFWPLSPLRNGVIAPHMAILAVHFLWPFFFFFSLPPSPYSPVAQLYGEGNYERGRAFFSPARGLSHGITCHPHAMRYMAGEGVRGLLATRLPSFFPPTPAMPIILPASSSSSTWSFFLDSLAVSKIILTFYIFISINYIKFQEMIGQAIFADYSSDNPKEDNRVTYCDLLDDDKYVAQFLRPDDLNLNCCIQSAQEPMIEMIPFEPENVQVHPEDPHSEQGKQKKRSSFHNFQKHLVTTIRCIIDSSRLAKDSDTAQCQKKIWRIFMNSNKINKTLVTLVVGDLNLEAPTKINQYGFKEIMKEFKPSQIKQAQQNINEEVVRQLLEADVEKQLINRRMRNKKQFVVYFQAFLEELVHGELEKRMAKCTKLLKSESH